MDEPVVTPSGITYEHRLLLEHLNRNGPTDPLTRRANISSFQPLAPGAERLLFTELRNWLNRSQIYGWLYKQCSK